MTDFHPIQIGDLGRNPRLPTDVTMRAYEVYCHIYREQPAMITGNCRGGFGVGELVAFLYARSFPKEEWSARAEEAMRRDPREPR